MGLFNKKEDYNLELQKAVEEFSHAGAFRQGTVVNKIKKYAKQKLKKETGFSNKQFKLLKDVTGISRGAKILNYDIDTLRLIHLQPSEFDEKYKENTIEKLTTTGITVTFPLVEQELINNTLRNAAMGG